MDAEGDNRVTRFMFHAHRVQLIGELHARVRVGSSQVDLVTLDAWLVSAWIKSRNVIEFLIKTSPQNKFELALDYVDTWRPPAEHVSVLTTHLTMITEHIAHQFKEPGTSGAFEDALVDDVFSLCDLYLDALRDEPSCDDLAPLWESCLTRARLLVSNPGRMVDLASIVMRHE